jgi:cytochrome c-type biogenesis protein CcmE
MTSRTRRTRRPLVAGALIICAAFAYLVYGGIEGNLVYFLTPTELLARGPAGYDAAVRLGGEVKPQSVHWNAQALDLRFRLTDGDSEIEVRSRGAPPQMFRDGMSVVVEGQLRPEGIFESHNLMVMHSNEYYPESDAADGPPHPSGGSSLPAGHPRFEGGN